MSYYSISFRPLCTLDEIEAYLATTPFTLSYLTQEEDGSCSLVGTGDITAFKHPLFATDFTITKIDLPAVDWAEQAKLFAPHFSDGKIEIKTAHGSFFLEPGQAFGDASHETTKLMLALLAHYVKNTTVLDIGTGSAILAIAAVIQGATAAFGVDIDPAALVTAKRNVQLNGLEKKIWIGQKEDLVCTPQGPLTILANMISSELEVIFAEYAAYFTSQYPGIHILSGLLYKERKKMLQLAKKRGWKLLEEKREGNWLAFVFAR